MTVLYFTSTGNCLSVAKKIGGTLVSIPQAIKKNQYSFSDNKIGIIFPVYGLSVPPLIIEFISKVKLNSKYIFGVLTYGTYQGAAINQLSNTATKNNINFSYINSIHMNENYLPGFAMEKQSMPKDEPEKENAIISDINKSKNFIKNCNWFARFMTNAHQKNYGYVRGVGETKNFIVSDSCSGCGTCVKVCPIDNINLQNEKPVFGDDCISCLACIQNCPQNIISMKTEKSKSRYRNKSITLNEIIEANK